VTTPVRHSVELYAMGELHFLGFEQLLELVSPSSGARLLSINSLSPVCGQTKRMIRLGFVVSKLDLFDQGRRQFEGSFQVGGIKDTLPWRRLLE
jgi:hypothetical protein